MIDIVLFEVYTSDLFVFNKRWAKYQVRKHQQELKEAADFKTYLGTKSGSTWYLIWCQSEVLGVIQDDVQLSDFIERIAVSLREMSYTRSRS